MRVSDKFADRALKSSCSGVMVCQQGRACRCHVGATAEPDDIRREVIGTCSPIRLVLGDVLIVAGAPSNMSSGNRGWCACGHSRW
ncbi:hypothetical protein CFBP7129_27115 (plasmid) [Agrobacterium tumefaciens]|uniref:Uncharacterized protein n=1 Tax=Agrobacterium tumefaciens TaxID=358 RepID=A0A4D7YVC6_AGRTU|nr:hypothetical protein CFBP7129_27115 [Agrobacterium tumefaciens]